MGSIQSRQMAIGYRTPGSRPSCGNCAHVEKRRVPTFLGDTTRWDCLRYGFQVMNLAVCNRHAPIPQEELPPSAKADQVQCCNHDCQQGRTCPARKGAA